MVGGGIVVGGGVVGDVGGPGGAVVTVVGPVVTVVAFGPGAVVGAAVAGGCGPVVVVTLPQCPRRPSMTTRGPDRDFFIETLIRARESLNLISAPRSLASTSAAGPSTPVTETLFA